MIGIFDSGLGGLSVLAAIARALPRADITYVADTAYVPYGPRDDAFIRGRVLAIGQLLVERGCTLIVVACNTATVAAVTFSARATSAWLISPPRASTASTGACRGCAPISPSISPRAFSKYSRTAESMRSISRVSSSKAAPSSAGPLLAG